MCHLAGQFDAPTKKIKKRNILFILLIFYRGEQWVIKLLQLGALDLKFQLNCNKWFMDVCNVSSLVLINALLVYPLILFILPSIV